MPITSNFHDQLYEYYDWTELGQLVFELCQQILTTEKKFDRLIALSKGGLTFARSLVDYLDIPDISIIKIEFYTGIGDTTRTPIITQSLPVNIQNEKILIFDDLVDSGETLELAKKYISQHGAKKVETAILFRKEWTKIETNYHVKESKAWIIFPNEVRSTTKLLMKIWQKKGDNDEQIKLKLQQIGFPADALAMFGPGK